MVLIVNRYEIAYDMILDMQQEIIPELMGANGRPDYRSVNALSATYILQDYLTGKIAVIGESPEGDATDAITWDRIKEALELVI